MLNLLELYLATEFTYSSRDIRKIDLIRIYIIIQVTIQLSYLILQKFPSEEGDSFCMHIGFGMTVIKQQMGVAHGDTVVNVHFLTEPDARMCI